MKLKPALSTLSLPVLALGISCASIVGKPDHVMPIRSTPSEADILIKDEAGAEMFRGKTPTTVTLPKSTGKYWGKKSYQVTLKKDGFQDQNYTLAANANGWYIGGNIVFGGLIGWFLVDPFNGKMYNMTPDTISATLSASPQPAPASTAPAPAEPQPPAEETKPVPAAPAAS